MEHSKYNFGFKTVAVLLQMVFIMVVIVIFSLLSNLFERSMLSFRDLGNSSFFHSSYYMETVAEEIRDLVIYLQLKDTSEQTELQTEKYKKMKLKFDNGDSNFYYWFALDGDVSTNMPGGLSKEEALSHAKELGSYFYYDDTAISFQGNFLFLDRISNIEILRLFSQGAAGGSFITAVDESLPKNDKIKDARDEYNTYIPWVKTGIGAAIISLLCFVLSLIYITLATGRNGEDDKIHLHRIDYIPGELLCAAFLAFVMGLFAFCARLGRQSFSISSSLILTGTLVFLSDVFLLTLYMSFVRRIKADIFVSCSLASRSMRILKESIRRQRLVSWAMIRLFICTVLEVFFVWEAAFFGKRWALAGSLAIFLYLSFDALKLANARKKILEGVLEIGSGKLDYKFDTREFDGDYKELAEKINGIGEGLYTAVEENVKNERLKTELITNVSHDIKTPLTSIINYIDLIKMEQIENENLENYVSILEKKSQRLKQLAEDLVEVSQITSGNILLDMQPINMVELIYQTGGEFNEIFEDLGLTIVTRLPKDPVIILADGNRIWRVIQNLYNNAAKYALKDTRIYVELKKTEATAEFSIKDISAHEIHQTAQDLSERFVRGDESRGTEGSGLGLSIARNLTNLMGGTFEIVLDGDLFTVSITFPLINP